MHKGYDWAGAPQAHSTDITSSAYPERHIRPLPKRRLRSRLSLEEADTIIFPPVPPSSSPLFGSPNNHHDRNFHNNHYTNNIDALHDDNDLDHVCDCGGHHSDSDEDEEYQDRSAHRNSWPGRMIRYPREYLGGAASRAKPVQSHSAGSSADGYESFENTNNKKKRKIPVSGASGTGLNSDGSSMSIPTHSVDVSGSQDSHYYQTGSGVGISGAGRGRNSKTSNRPLNERRPLTSTSNGSNIAQQGPHNQQGIISAAIANAAEVPKASASLGQENISLLQRQQHASSVPKDFTFEWPSDSAHKMSLSARGPMSPPSHSSAYPNANRGMPTQGTHMKPNGSRQNAGQPIPSGPADAYTQNQQPMPPPKVRRRRRDSLREAAQQRKTRQAYENSTNPPNLEDRYICEFCEFEAIFGHAPTALIRQYEIRDRQRRKREDAQRRNLEKVKAKGRKNKKGAKSAVKNNTATGADTLPPPTQPYDPRSDAGGEDLDSQGDEYFDDGYDDPAPLPSQQDQATGAQRSAPPPPPPPPPDEIRAG